MLLPRRSLLKALSWLALMPLLRNPALAADEDGVDLEAPAKVRPGMPTSALRAAVGRHWREPPEDKFVEFDALRRSHGFKALVSSTEVAVVEYLEGFDETISIDGV